MLRIVIVWVAVSAVVAVAVGRLLSRHGRSEPLEQRRVTDHDSDERRLAG